MENLTIHNENFITYTGEILTIDVPGGVDLKLIERMVCTLRVSYQNYPPYRTTLDLYSEQQTDKLIRSVCDKWGLKLLDVSQNIHQMVTGLEKYRLANLGYTGKNKQQFTLNEKDKKEALKILKSKNLLKLVNSHLNQAGIIGEDSNAQTLFMALASHKSGNPFSVICLAKSGIGKSYILQKLSQCSPEGSFTFHTQISENAIYYMNSGDIDQKILFVEDLEWTGQMLTPLSTLQTHRRLVKTRATKNKDGMLHSTTFEVKGKLCLLACTYPDKNHENMGLPFLMLNLNHSGQQDADIMDYQKKIKAGLINQQQISQSQHILKTLLASLQNLSVINPYAQLIDLPADVAHPRKSLLLLLNFIETVTFFHQYQRNQHADKETGEIFIKTHPDDIKLAFKLLKNSIFRRADELSTVTRGFYRWLVPYLEKAKTDQFTALDIRKEKAIHPRTLNRYLQELKTYSYIQVTGGNKHREGYRYKLTGFGDQNGLQERIGRELEATLDKIYQKHSQTTTNNGQKENSTAQTLQEQDIDKQEDTNLSELSEGAACTYEKIQAAGGSFITEQVAAITGKSKRTESRYLKELADKGLLKRTWDGNQYHYATRTVGQNPMPTPKTGNDNTLGAGRQK